MKGVEWTLTLAGFLLYLLVITSYRLPVGDVAVLMALGGVALHGRVRFPLYLVLFTVFALWATVAATRSAFPEVVSPQLTLLLKLLVIIFVAANALRTRAQIRLFMVFFLGCFALFPLRGAMFNFFLYANDLQGRAIWNHLYNNPNDLGAMALLQLSMALALLATEPKGWVRWSALAGVLLLPLLILMTQSRGVFLGLLVFLAVAFLGHRRRLQLLFRLTVVGLVLAALAPASVWERFGTLRHATNASTLDQVDGEGGSARQRYEIWQVGFKIIREHPLTGVGIGAYEVNHEQYALHPEFNPTARGPRDAHSLYFNVLAETGYPGLVLYLAGVLAAVVSAERTRRRCKRVLEPVARQFLMLEAGLAGFLVAAVFGSLPYLPHFLLHLVLLHAMAALYRQELRGVQGHGASGHSRSAAWARNPRPARAPLDAAQGGLA